jgi:RNA-directed DNA polymerase
LDAVAQCRERCWQRDWVIDLDIKAFFDSVDHDLMVKAVKANVTPEQRWVVLYVKRWLTAPIRLPDGTLAVRDRGTPQGSAISPILANLFLHYAFDTWLDREWPAIRFERYADDAVIHCVSERQARQVLAELAARLTETGLTLHPDKTRIVYCKDGNRNRDYPDNQFVFLGYQFRARTLRTRQGSLFTSFAPAASPEALRRMSAEVRAWRLHRHMGTSLLDVIRWISPIIRGWITYYGRFGRDSLHPLLCRINGYLIRWARKKWRSLRSFKRAKQWWERLTRRHPRAFAHWTQTTGFVWMW